MPRNLARLFRESAAPGPQKELLDAVMDAVGRERRRTMLVRRLPLLAAGLLLSGAAAAYAVVLTINDASRSGLAGFLSVFVTDTGAVMSLWQDYLLTLLDTLPVAPIAGACAALFIFFALLRRLDRVVSQSSRPHFI
ncbi:MAG: hypothetical protein RL272_581 [Candidatus Parcubacteria bacterium]|jgi:hypothetical protein